MQSIDDDFMRAAGSEQMASLSSRRTAAHSRAEADRDTGRSDGTAATAILVHC